MLNSTCEAAVTITPASGLCLNNSPGAYTAIGNIVILEGANADVGIQSGATIILSAPAGFEFLAGTGTVSVAISSNITTAPAPTIAVTAATITITFSCTGINNTDRITIGAIQARGLVAGSSGTILRTGGTAVINGDAVVDGINHGSLTSLGTGTLISSVADGNWSASSTWSTGSVPTCGQDIIIRHNVTADVISSAANVTIETGGNLVSTNAITITGTFSITGTGIYTHDNTGDASTTIFSGSEIFSANSSIIINQWYNLNMPLGNPVNGNFGNITFNVPGEWQQDGNFAPARISGNIIINSGTISMDDGTGMTTYLSLNDVTINGTGNLKVCYGTARDFTLNTKNFTDNGTGATLSFIKSNCSGTLTWNATGDVNLTDHFSFMVNSGSPTFAVMNISGDMNITGGKINFISSTNVPFTLTVGGRTLISGNPIDVNFANTGSGAFIFNSSDLEITAPGTFRFLSGTFSGTNQFTITNDLIITGDSTVVYFLKIQGYSSNLNINTGRDILIKNSDVYFANSVGSVYISGGRNFSITGSNSEVHGQNLSACPGSVNFTINGTFTITNAIFYETKGEGNISLIVGEALIIDNGNFYGIRHTSTPAQPTSYFAFQDFILNGGFVNFFNVKTATITSVTVVCSNNFDVNFESNSDAVELVAYDGNNDATLDLNIGGNFTVTGNYPGAYFISSKGGGNEIVTINGNFSVNGAAKVFFVCNDYNLSGIDAHDIVFTINGDINITGGTTFLSTRDGQAIVDVGGDFLISGGILNLKWLKGEAILTINGDYQQTGGTFNMHSRAASISDICRVVVNGEFSQTAGIFNFDNGSGPAEHTLTINGPDFSIGGTAVITHANNLSTTYVFGLIYFNRSGTTVFSRNSSTHNIQHVRQTIRSGTIVDASASTNGFQMTSVASATTAIHNALTVEGTLDMGDKILSARQNTNYYSRVSISNGARYRTSHTGGLYSGSSVTSSSINGYISSLNRVSYFLHANSTVEYYGTTTSVVTGIPNGIATGTDQEYGILEINFSGTAGSTWVYPETADEVYIRTTLVLTEGEFNLDNDHITTNGGRAINLRSGATATRTNGFIRSETEDGSGVVKWNITTNSSNTIPFGYDATNYIPFTFQQTSGSADIVQIGTYRTIADNTPYPPTVTHTRDVNGIENSSETVDRFWNITVPGSTSANLTFTYVPSEGTGIISPRAQQWEPVTMGWFPPAGVQSNLTVNSTTASGLSSFNTWWTLSSLASPLPIELASFEVHKSDGKTDISWITQTEINNDYFTIERSTDGSAFETIRIIDGAGTSTSPLNYSVTDNRPLSGRNYYRLMQTDFDGHFTYSEIKSVTFENQGAFSVYPNPATVASGITISTPGKGSHTIRIADITGRLIYNKTVIVNDGDDIKITPFDIEIKAGIYSLTITCEDTSYSHKLIIRK